MARESNDVTLEPEEAEASAPDSPARNPAGPLAFGVVLLLLALVAGYAFLDRLAPSSDRGVVSAAVVPIAPRVSGEVTVVHVADDAVVEAGEPLFSIDPRPFELAVRQAEANLASALQGVDASSASLVAAQADVTRARATLEKARADSDRTLRLEERGIVAVAEGDAARAAVSETEAQLAAAEANLEGARATLGPIDAENASVAAAQAQLEGAQYDLASTTVLAPHFGVVTNVTLASGQFASAGSPALTFIDAEAAWVTVDLRENQLVNIEPGDPARLLFDALPGRVFDGRVQSVAWGIDPGRSTQGGLVVNQPATRWFEPARRIPVRLELDGGMEAWPSAVRVGGKVHATVFAGGTGNPVAWLARAVQRGRAWLSFLY